MGVSDRINSQFQMIVGSTSDVTNRTATHDSLQAAISGAVDGYQILVLSSYNTVESITHNKRLNIIGMGNATQIYGTYTLSAGSSNSMIKFLRFTDNLTINNTSNNNIVTDCWIASGKTVTDNNLSPNNLISILGEE
jgi:hypothetical protein